MTYIATELSILNADCFNFLSIRDEPECDSFTLLLPLEDKCVHLSREDMEALKTIVESLLEA